MKKILQMLSSALLFIAVSGQVAAQTFEVPDTDQSKKIFIDSLFGPLVGAGDSEFSSVIGMFNAAMLLLAGILVAYTLVAGTMSTAHDGEMLGKRWSSMWIPIRTSVGAAMIFPLSSGFCAIQYIVMWIAMQGIGFADKMVSAFMNQQYDETGSSFVPPSNYQARRQLLEKWLVAATCEKAIGIQEAIARQGRAAAIYLINPAAGATAAIGPENAPVMDGTQYWYGAGMCGNISIFNSGNETFAMDDNFMSFDMEMFSDQMYQSNVSQMGSIKGKIETLATKIAEGSTDHETMKREVAVNLDEMAKTWDKTMKDQAIALYKGQMQTNGERYKNSVIRDGWLTFGGWYMEMARTQDGIARALSNVPSVSSNAYERVQQAEKDGIWGALFKNNYFSKDAQSAIKLAHEFATYTTVGAGGNALNAIEPSNVSAYLVKWFITPDYKSMFDDNQDFGQNPVLMAQNLGRNMVGWGTGGYVAGMAAILFFDREIVGTSTFKLSVLGPMLTAVAGTILVTGAFLSVYPPMLPYILWIGAILGWVIFLVEAIIAAPLWAVAQIAPDGDGVVGKGGQGYMLVLSLFMRPALMVLGFISAVIVMKPMGYLINSTFLGAFLNAASPSWYGVITAIMGCILYATLMVSVINRVFALIHVIPDKILRWMGGGGDSDLGSAAQGVEGTAMQKLVTGAGAARTLAESGVGGAERLRNMQMNQASHARSLKEQEAQSDQGMAQKHRDEVTSSIEEGDDGLRSMRDTSDLSQDGDALFNGNAEKVKGAAQKNRTNSVKAALAEAKGAISNLAKKGDKATKQERDDAAAAQQILSDAGNLNPSNNKEVNDFLRDSAGKYQNTSWGNILNRSRDESGRMEGGVDSLANIRNRAKQEAQNKNPGNPNDAEDNLEP